MDILNNKISNVMSSVRAEVVVLKDEESTTQISNKRVRDTTQGELKEHTRKKQIIQGRIDMNKQNSSNLLIVSEYWPSFLMGYDMPTASSHVWVVSEPCAPTIQKLLPASIRWVGEEEGRRILKGQGCHWVVIQGSLKFVEATLNTWCTIDTNEHTNLIVCSPAKRYRVTTGFLNKIKCWKNVSHDLLGGVTSSKWRIGVWSRDTYWEATDLHQFCQAYGLDRRLSDIILPTESGRVSTKPDVPLNTLFNWGVNSLTQEFILPGIFSSTRFVKRCLVGKEIAGLFDVSDDCLRKMDARSSPSSEMMIQYFNQDIPPMKVAQLLVNILLFSPSQKIANVKSIDVSENLQQLIVTPPSEEAGESRTPRIKDEFENCLKMVEQKAAKDDDAIIPVHYWNEYLFAHGFAHISYTPKHGRALEIIRAHLGYRLYKKRLTRSFLFYLKKMHGKNWCAKYYITKNRRNSKKRKLYDDHMNLSLMDQSSFNELDRDLTVGRDCLTRAVNGSWWEWLDGSSCFFWRWPKPIRKSVRDGYPVFIQGRLPTWKRKQDIPRQVYMQIKMKEKLLKVTQRRYIIPGKVTSLIHTFAVPKGDDDIRLVYDGTKSKLNASTFAPNFFLPSIDSMLMSVDAASWFGDHDLGEMFLNYFLNDKIQKYSGLDLTKILGSKKTDWRVWGRMFMGFSPSPYIACKLFGWTIDMLMGNRWDKKNPFRWDSVKVNLPGSSCYDPSKPRVCKMWEGKIAAVVEAYVDDIRSIGSSEDNCKLAGCRAAQIYQYLGQQDAARKYRPPRQRPGPWCGTFVGIYDDSVWVYVSDAKWEKAKLFVSELQLLLLKGADLNHKFLERGRGFLVYFCRTYTSMTPFLKGLHLTLDSWREGRDEKGWKLPKKVKRVLELSRNNREEEQECEEDCDNFADDFETSDITEEPPDPIPLAHLTSEDVVRAIPPTMVQEVSRLKADINTLAVFLSADKAPWRFVRGSKVAVAHYGFGDASKSGFGATIQGSTSGVWFRLGVWSCQEEAESSNYRELANLVETLEERAKLDEFRGVELFLFTDNSTAEASFYRGTSSSPKLYQLIVRLRLLEVARGCLIHFIHVAGTRMIEQGTDGLSRGDFTTGVMGGKHMSLFVPIHLSCLERESKLKSWITKIVAPSKKEGEITFLDCAGWFERGHDISGGTTNDDGVWEPLYKRGIFIWTPPPAAAQVAVEQLRRARGKREDSTHVVVVPKLMAPEWRRQLHRVSDLYIELPFVDECWTKSNHHEPLTLAIVFPFLSHSPWQLKRTAAFLGMGGVLRGLFQTNQITPWIILRKLFQQQRRLESLPEGVVREMLRSPRQFGLLHT